MLGIVRKMKICMVDDKICHVLGKGSYLQVSGVPGVYQLLPYINGSNYFLVYS